MGNAKTVSVLFYLFLLFSCLTFTDAFFGRRHVGKRSGVNKVGYLQSYSIIIFFVIKMQYHVTIVVDVLMESTN